MRAPLAVVLLLSVALAGCAEPQVDPSIRWTAPTDSEAGAFTRVQWQVEAFEGTVTHADVHAGPSAVKSPRARSYPLVFGAHNLTGPSFAASALFPDEGTWFVRPHVVVGGEGVWGKERRVTVQGGLSLEARMSAFVRADGEAQGRYAASRDAAANHFGVHRLADGSAADHWHVGEGGNGVEVAIEQDGVLAFPAPEPGWGEYRLHVQADGRDYWSAPFALTSVEMRVRLVDPPAEVPAGEAIRFAWRVEGAPVVVTSHTGVHYASGPWDGLAGNVSVRAMAHEGGPAPVAVPGTFTVEHAFDGPGTRTLRAHLRLGAGEGALDFWSEPHEVSVT